jgi:hypothetical protein
MATTTGQNDFGRVKRWGKEFLAAGTAVVLGSLMPWVSFNGAGAEVKPGAKAASVVLGSYSISGGEISYATKKIPHPIRHYGRKLHRKMNVRLARGGEVVACCAAG